MGYKMVKGSIKMKKKSILLVLFAMLIITSCKFTNNKEIVSSELKIIPIERESYKTYTFNNEKERKEYIMGESVLVLNPPDSKEQLISMMLKYWEEHAVAIDEYCNFYAMGFHLYDSKSLIYLTQSYRNDINGVTYYLLDDYKYRIGAIYVKPNLTDSGQWIVSMSVSKKDEEREYYIEDSYYSVLDSCATLVDNKLILSTSIPE